MSAAGDTSHPLAASEDDILARARALVPVLAAREAEATAARNVPAETIDDFRRTGLLRLIQPRRFGGVQASVGVFMRAVEILAEGCASSAWVYAVLEELEWVIACLPEQGQLDIWGDDPGALAAGSIVPRAVGRPTDAGWRVSGRYAFASGCRHAQWLIAGVRCQGTAGHEQPRYLFIPMREVEIIDDWHAMGMRGTGSFSVALHDVFVPEHRSVVIADINAGTPPGRLVHPDCAMLRAPRYFLVPFVLPAVGFGLARRALTLVPTALRGRGLAASDVLHLRLGEAAALIESALLVFSTRRADSVARLESGTPIPEAEVLRNRRDVVLAFQMIRQGVERLVALNGARTVNEVDPLQAILRDLTTIGTHIIVNEEAGMVPYGRFLMRTV
jgi:3-hydroxy-9,10-secoandrosta-1,3,5(10)-triene-9,17-dione monooxygenase